MNLRYVIVEDELTVRRGTEIKMRRTGLPFELAGVAEDGAQGLELIRREHPDLAIIDMRMPDMDGMALMEQLRREGNRVEMIVASGYSSFEYARAGIRADVCEYLLKPFSESELREAVLRAMTRMRRNDAAPPEPQPDADAECKLLSGYLMGMPERDSVPQFAALNIDPERGRYIVCEANYAEPPRLPTRPYSLDELVTLSVPNMPSRRFYIAYARAGISGRAINALKIELSDALNIGISAICPDLYRLFVARKQAQEARRDHPLASASASTHVICEYTEPQAIPLLPAELTQALLLALQVGNAAQFRALLEQRQADCAREGWSLNQYVAALRAFLAGAIEYFVRADDAAELPTLFQFDYLAQRCESDGELPRAIVAAIAAAFDSQQRRDDNADVIERMRAYIDLHFADELGLERVSQLFGISTGYASQLFRQRTGDSYVNYINALRIRHAQQLLLDTTLDTAIIARRCGFEGVKYFYRVFKRQTGLTPNDYRKQCSRGHPPVNRPT